jgi:hypothetical protein
LRNSVTSAAMAADAISVASVKTERSRTVIDVSWS